MLSLRWSGVQWHLSEYCSSILVQLSLAVSGWQLRTYQCKGGVSYRHPLKGVL